MFKYQIHKLSKGAKEARAVLLEDILTSDVFGVMEYFPYDILLRPFLAQVAARNPKANFQVPHVEPTHFSFWEGIPCPDSLPYLNRESIEPDVVIEWNEVLLIIEAKFISPTDPKELLREYLVGSMKSRIEKNFFLLLIDKNLLPPTVSIPGVSRRVSILDYIETRIKDLKLSEQFSPKLVRSSILWTNWQSFYALVNSLLQRAADGDGAIRQVEKLALSDLLSILERKGLIPFERLELSDFEKFQIDLASLKDSGLIMRRSFSDLSDISIDLGTLGKIGLKVNDVVPFLSSIVLDPDCLHHFLNYPDDRKGRES